MAGVVSDAPTEWRVSAERAARRLAATSTAGALLGFFVGGIGGRLAMMLLAVRNPQATGVTSDDGFRMGQFTTSGTLALLVTTTLLGVFGGGIYLVLRHLMIGPRWFQVMSISCGPAVVVGSMLVHTDGVDFTLLQPAELAITLFVAIPLVFAALLTLLAEQLLAPDGWFARAPRSLALAPLLTWIPLFLPGAVLALGWLAREWTLRLPASRATLKHPLMPWIARLILALLFIAGLLDLARDAATLT